MQLKQRGFSLIEVLITVAVLATGLAAMARFQGVVLQGSSLARERSEAVALAEQKIEQLRNYRQLQTITNTVSATGVIDFSDIQDANACPTSGRSETINTATAVYTRTCYSAPPTVSSSYSYITITVQVSWSRPGASGNSDAANVILTTVITNTDPRYSGEVV
ncbi:MAG: prepilin-type N-terminal cleavage/methylation domain-containing protein [Pseudomonadota bacterium]